MSSTPIYLLKDRRPDSCFVDQIYNPDRDGLPSDTMAVVIPSVGAIAIDRDNGNAAYVVEAVDEITYKSTLKPIKIIQTEDTSAEIEILSYGNDKFMLYFDDRTKPTALVVDGKLRIFGSALCEYRLIHEKDDGSEEIISLYIDSNATYKGDRIPMVSVQSGSNLKQCTNCNTLHTLTEGDTVRLEVFDTIGIMEVSVKLITKRSTILNDLDNSVEIITGFTATADQMDGNNFYIYQRQSPETLAIAPRITYSNGVSEDITIDKISCFVYGLDDFIPAYPGQQQKILIKKYLGRNQVSDLSETDGRNRFITLTKYITVKSNKALAGIKISLIPIWDLVRGTYSFKCIAYTDTRDKMYDVTGKATISGFDGGLFNVLQEVILDLDLSEVFGTSESVIYRQIVYVSLKPYSEYQRYLLKDSSTDSYVYGTETSDMRRPVIHFDTATQKYFIPTSRFKNKEAFLESFYLMARPPYDTETEITPTVPTYFTIRNVDTLNTVIATPIPVEQYNQLWNITLNGSANQLTNSQVIVEFLTLVNNEYQIIYGVPVDTYTSLTGYNTDLNN